VPLEVELGGAAGTLASLGDHGLQVLSLLAEELALDEPVSAITPGQSVAFYDGDRVLGGGFIEASRPKRGMLPVLAA